MDGRTTEHEALALLRRHCAGVLVAHDMGGDRAVRARFVRCPRTGLVATHAPGSVVRAESHVLFVPDEDDNALQLLLAGRGGAPEALVDRWRIHHGDPPSRAPGDLKGEPGEEWAVFEIESARLGSAVLDGEALRAPNPLWQDEPRLCRRLNEDRRRLARALRASIGASIDDPLAVAVDPGGVLVRGPIGLVRAPFGGEAADGAAAMRHVETFLTLGGKEP